MSKNKNNNSVPVAWLKILLSVAILLLCFFRNRVIPQDNETLVISGTVATVLLILLCLRLVASAIGTLAGAEKNAAPQKLPDQPIKLWDRESLLSYLEQEDIIDIVLGRENGETLKVGTRSDYRRERYGKAEYFDKCYYIEEEEYTDFSDFVAQFMRAHEDETVRILYVGIEDMPVEIP